MLNIMLRLFGERALHKAVDAKTMRNPLDIKFGIALLRDRRIAFRFKLISFGLAVGLFALLLALEVPVEAVATFLAPVLLPLDFAIDGLELVALPLLFTALLTAYVAPRPLVDEIRAERLAPQNSAVIDVESYDPNTVPALPAAPTVPLNQPLYAGSQRP